MRRTALAVAALLAASPALAAGAYVTRNVQDGSGAHTQSYWDESGIGIGPFDPVTQLPNGTSLGGGSTGGGVFETGSSTAAAGIVPVTATATSVVGKGSAGNLYSAYAMATAAPTAQEYLACINAAAAPSPSGAIAPLDIVPIGLGVAAVGNSATINFEAGPPNAYSTGITCLITTSLTTYTAGANAFISVRVR